eukprot:5056749-Pleurochrysis_carterae.AAC.6
MSRARPSMSCNQSGIGHSHRLNAIRFGTSSCKHLCASPFGHERSECDCKGKINFVVSVNAA